MKINIKSRLNYIGSKIVLLLLHTNLIFFSSCARTKNSSRVGNHEKIEKIMENGYKLVNIYSQNFSHKNNLFVPSDINNLIYKYVFFCNYNGINNYLNDKQNESKDTLQLSSISIANILSTNKDLLEFQDGLNNKLYICCGFNKKISEIKRLINLGADVNTEGGEYKLSCLHRAISRNKIEVVKLLLEHKVNINTKDFQNKTPLMKSIDWDLQEIFNLLIKSEGIKTNPLKNTSENLLHYATRQLNPYYFSNLTKLGIFDLNARGLYGRTVLHYSLLGSNYEIFEILINSKNIKIDAIDDFNSCPLHYAVTLPDKRFVTHLLDKNANMYLRDSRHYTPFDIAICFSKLDIIKEFIRTNYKICLYQENDIHPLDLAIAKGNISVLEYLYERIPLISDYVIYRGLFLANKPEIIEFFIKKIGHDLFNKNTIDCKTPLHYYVSNNLYLNIEYLIDNKIIDIAYINLQDDEGNTPLHYAVYHNKKHIVLLLLKNGAEPRLSNKKSETPISIAESSIKYSGINKIFQEYI